MEFKKEKGMSYVLKLKISELTPEELEYRRAYYKNVIKLRKAERPQAREEKRGAWNKLFEATNLADSGDVFKYDPVLSKALRKKVSEMTPEELAYKRQYSRIRVNEFYRTHPKAKNPKGTMPNKGRPRKAIAPSEN